MKRRNIILLAALFVSTIAGIETAGASERAAKPDRTAHPAMRRNVAGRIGITDRGTRLHAEDMNVRLAITPGDMRLLKNEKLVVQPVVVSERDTVYLPYVTIYGKNRYKYDRRMEELYGNYSPEESVYTTVIAGKNQPQEIVYDLSVPSSPSLYGGQVAVIQELYGCGGSRLYLGTDDLGTLVPPHAPVISFLIAPIPAPQVREDTLTARIAFPFDRWDLQRSFMNNAHELARMDTMTMEIISAPGVQARQVFLTGYASPEGSWTYNDGLSERRMQTIKGYVEDNYGLEDLVVVSHIPEDWEGVRSHVERSNLPHKEEVLKIIDGIPDPDARDRAIRQIDGGATYRTMLQQIYPALRRVDYRIRYDIAPRTVESAREAYRKNPEQLTIYELYSVADSYPCHSEEYADVWATVCRLYPDDQTALHNAAAAALYGGDYDRAQRYMERENDCPQKLNNLGAIAYYNGDYRAAEQFFTEAAQAGCVEAAANLENIYSTKPITF